MAYRLAKSLVALRDSVNAAAPVRSRASDGWIGDASHASRSSDHNPWVKDGSTGVVTALDITNDPAHGVTGQALANALIADKRVKYVIWNRRIYNAKVAKAWRAYKGKNPHDKHVHVSVLPTKSVYDSDAPWDVGMPKAEPPPQPEAPLVEEQKPTLKIGAQGGDVFELQRLLGIKVDGDFGTKTQAAVKAFQKAQGLVADGIVGPYTWRALEAKQPPAGNVEPLMAVSADLGPIPVRVGETLVGHISPAAATKQPPSTPREAVSELQSLGWSRLDAITWVAHLMWESGGSRANEIVWDAEGDSGNSHGAGQWNEGAGRFKLLEDYAAAHGLDWKSPEAQLGFLDHELQTSERGTAKAVRSATTLEEKMKAATNYWRPGVPHLERRQAVAQRLEKEIPT